MTSSIIGDDCGTANVYYIENDEFLVYISDSEHQCEEDPLIDCIDLLDDDDDDDDDCVVASDNNDGGSASRLKFYKYQDVEPDNLKDPLATTPINVTNQDVEPDDVKDPLATIPTKNDIKIDTNDVCANNYRHSDKTDDVNEEVTKEEVIEQILPFESFKLLYNDVSGDISSEATVNDQSCSEIGSSRNESIVEDSQLSLSPALSNDFTSSDCNSVDADITDISVDDILMLAWKLEIDKQEKSRSQFNKYSNKKDRKKRCDCYLVIKIINKGKGKDFSFDDVRRRVNYTCLYPCCEFRKTFVGSVYYVPILKSFTKNVG